MCNYQCCFSPHISSKTFTQLTWTVCKCANFFQDKFLFINLHRFIKKMFLHIFLAFPFIWSLFKWSPCFYYKTYLHVEMTLMSCDENSTLIRITSFLKNLEIFPKKKKKTSSAESLNTKKNFNFAFFPFQYIVAYIFWGQFWAVDMILL